MTTADQRERFRGHLADVMHSLRPEWDVAGCVAALRALPPDLPPAQVAICAVRYCADNRNQTPAMVADLGNQAWVSDWYLPCKIHPQTRARRDDGSCAACWTDRAEDPSAGQIRDRGGVPIPAEARELIDAAITARHGGGEV